MTAPPPQTRLAPLVLAVGAALGLVAWLALGFGPAPLPTLRGGHETSTADNGVDGPRAGPQARRAPLTADPERVAAASPFAAPGVFGHLVQDGAPLPGATIRLARHDEVAPATSDAAGAFALPGVDGLDDWLTIAGPTVPPDLRIGPFAVARGQAFDLGTIDVPRAVVVTGRVLDGRGGSVGGARVFAAHDGAMFRVDVVDPTDADADPNTATDSRGRFALDGLLPGRIRLRIEHGDHLIERIELAASSGERRDLGDLVLQRAEPLRGTVRDEHGAPVAGVRVVSGGGAYDWQLAERQAVHTDAAGRFALRGRPAGVEALTLTKAGLQTTLLEPLGDLQPPFEVTMHAALSLHGRVLGNGGRQGLLLVAARTLPRESRWAGRLAHASHPIAADGSFDVRGLPAGEWTVRAFFADAGHAAAVRCVLPLREPVELEFVPGRVATVHVVDADGAPIAGASVSHRPTGDAGPDLWAHGIDHSSAVTSDAAGAARLSVCAGYPVRISAVAPGHIGQSREFEAGRDAITLQLPLSPAGAIEGRLADAELGRHAHVRIRVAPIDNPDKRSSCTPDARGRFRTGALSPGRYRVQAEVGSAQSGAVAQPLPLLDGEAPAMAPVDVEVGAGAPTWLELPALRVGEVRGRVLRGGAAVADAVVLLQHRDDDDAAAPPPPTLNPLLHNRAMARTDSDGRFRILSTRSASFELLARAADGAAWVGPVPAPVHWSGDDAGEGAAVDLHLPSGAIIGRVDLAALPPLDRRDVRVELAPLRSGAGNPRALVWTADSTRQRRELGAQLTPEGDGRFAFRGLAAGTWVLRLRGGGDDWPRVIDLAADATVDLALLTPVPTPELAMSTGLGTTHGVEIRRVVGDAEVFVRAVVPEAAHGGVAFPWGALPPGRYRFHRCPVKQVRSSGPYRIHVRLELDDPTGAAVDVEVAADGSCQPAAVWPDGV